MKTSKILAVSAALLGLSVALAGCNDSSPHLASISVTAATPSIAIGSTDQLTVTGSISDGGTVPETANAQFVSSAPSIATVSALEKDWKPPS